MTVQASDVVFNPYDYDFHEDPYPYYKRLRDEAPLYRNDELKFWALSRHADVLQGFRNSTELSNSLGVSLDPISRTPDAHKVMSFLALDDPAHLRLRTLVSKGFTPRRILELEPRVTEIAVQHLDTFKDWPVPVPILSQLSPLGYGQAVDDRLLVPVAVGSGEQLAGSGKDGRASLACLVRP